LRKAILTEQAPKPLGPYSQAIIEGEFIFVAGQGCTNPRTGKLERGDVRSETKQVFANLEAILQAAGLVSGSPDPRDGRQTILSLTDACQEWIRAGQAAKEDWLFRAIQSKLSPEEQVELAGAVELLKRLAEGEGHASHHS